MRTLAEAAYQRRYSITHHAMERFIERTAESLRYRGLTEEHVMGDELDRCIGKAAAAGLVEHITDRADPALVVNLTSQEFGRLYALFKLGSRDGAWVAITVCGGEVYDGAFRTGGWRRCSPHPSAVAAFPAMTSISEPEPPKLVVSARASAAGGAQPPAPAPMSYLITWTNADNVFLFQHLASRGAVVEHMEKLCAEGLEKGALLYGELPLQVRKRVDVDF